MTETAAGRRRLGRGLEALLGPTRDEAEREGSLVELPIKDIKPNPFQPRQTVDPAALEELVSSIKQAGLLQPVVVRRANGGYELIAGERRLRACQQLGWQRIPAVQRDADDRTLLTLALIENLQRDDLSPLVATVRPSPTRSASSNSRKSYCRCSMRGICRWVMRARCSHSRIRASSRILPVKRWPRVSPFARSRTGCAVGARRSAARA